jgi:hypothetical protein
MSQERYFIFLGGLGAGKSTAVNSILGDRNACEESQSMAPVTDKSTRYGPVRFLDLDYFLIDMPGLGDASHAQADEHNIRILYDAIQTAGNAIHTFVIFFATRFDVRIVRLYASVLGDEFWSHVLFVKTGFRAFEQDAAVSRARTELHRYLELNHRGSRLAERRLAFDMLFINNDTDENR